MCIWYNSASNIEKTAAPLGDEARLDICSEGVSSKYKKGKMIKRTKNEMEEWTEVELIGKMREREENFNYYGTIEKVWVPGE